MVEAANGRPVLEFGMRRAPAEGADAASRASIVGGATSTSNSAVGLRARPHAGRHPRPLDGPAVPRPRRRRGGCVRGLRRRLPRRHAAARRHRRHARQRGAERDRHVRAAAPAGARAGGHPARLRRPRLPRRGGRPGARPGRLPRHRDRAVEPARRADDLADHRPDRRRGPPSRRRPRRRDRTARVRRRLAPGDERRRPEPRRGVQARRRRRRQRLVEAGDQALRLAGQGAQPGRQAALAGLRRARPRRRPTCCRRRTRSSRPGSLHLHHHARPDVSRSIVAGDVDELLAPGRRRAARSSPTASTTSPRRPSGGSPTSSASTPACAASSTRTPTTCRSPTSCSPSSSSCSPDSIRRPADQPPHRQPARAGR